MHPAFHQFQSWVVQRHIIEWDRGTRVVQECRRVTPYSAARGLWSLVQGRNAHRRAWSDETPAPPLYSPVSDKPSAMDAPRRSFTRLWIPSRHAATVPTAAYPSWPELSLAHGPGFSRCLRSLCVSSALFCVLHRPRHSWTSPASLRRRHGPLQHAHSASPRRRRWQRGRLRQRWELLLLLRQVHVLLRGGPCVAAHGRRHGLCGHEFDRLRGAAGLRPHRAPLGSTQCCPRQAYALWIDIGSLAHHRVCLAFRV